MCVGDLYTLWYTLPLASETPLLVLHVVYTLTFLVFSLSLSNNTCTCSLSLILSSLSLPLMHTLMYSHNQASSAKSMHTKLAGKDLPAAASTSSSRSTPPPPSQLPPPPTTTAHSAPVIEVTDETTGPPKSSEPNSPLSEEDFSSGGEQVIHLCIYEAQYTHLKGAKLIISIEFWQPKGVGSWVWHSQ